MKNKYHSVARPMALAVLSLVVSSGALAVEATAETSASLSKKELKTLLTTAKTPGDHQRIAEYYRGKAQRLNAKAQEFSAQADYLATQPGAIDPKQRISLQITVSRDRYLAEQYAQEAKESEVLATQQEGLSQINQVSPTQK